MGIQEVDVVVVGSGPAACALVAGLLFAHPPGTLSVAVLERGPPQSACPAVHVPLMFYSLVDPAKGVHRFIQTKQPEGRQSPLIVTAGHVLGGGSAVNFMHYSRGGASDYDAWPEGWRLKDLKPHFLKMESCGTVDDPSAPHAKDGPIQVTCGKAPLSLTSGFIEGAAKIGLPHQAELQDFKTAHGFSRASKTIDPKSGRRSDAYTKLLTPLQKTHPNDLHVLTSCTVSRVLFDSDNRATGCEYIAGGEPRTIKARQLVVLAAGALGTPGILERSGVGDPKVLKAAGVGKTVVDLPGVGERYMDHHLSVIRYRAKKGTSSLSGFFKLSPDEQQAACARFLEDPSAEKGLSTNAIDVYGKIRPAEEELSRFGEHADVVWQILKDHPTRSLYGIAAGEMPLNPPGATIPAGPVFVAATAHFHPRARGSIHITKTDPAVSGILDSKIGEDPADVAVLADGLRLADSLVRNTPFYEDMYDGPKGFSDADLNGYIKETAASCWHPMGTCAMAPREEEGVVDQRLNVHGLKGLKVADLSICPSNISAHLYMTALAVGGRAAEIINGELSA